MKHLLRVQNEGGDMHHPLDDPLWDSFAVKWFLSPRPPKLDAKTKKTAIQASQSRYYKKRKRIQDSNLETMEQRFRNGDIGVEEFKKILVGEKRRQFITSLRLQADFDQRFEREMERRVRETVQGKLGELRKKDTEDPANIANSAAIRDAIRDLQAAQTELNDTREALNYYQDLLLHKSEEVVQFYANKEFLSSDTSFLEYHKFQWPSEVSSSSFYLFAAMLLPQASWSNDETRSRSSIRHMALRLAEHIRLEKENVEESSLQHLEGIFSTFNSCCDLVTTEEAKTVSMSEEGRQTWLHEQAQLWATARAEFHLLFRFNSHAPIQQIKVIDDLADIWRMRTAAEKDNNDAIRNAQETADRV